MSQKPFPLKPIDDQVVILPDEKVGVSKGGIILPDEAKRRATTGRVVAVGPGRLIILQAGGAYHPLMVKVGDKVLYPPFDVREIEIGEVTYVVTREPTILAIYQNE